MHTVHTDTIVGAYRSLTHARRHVYAAASYSCPCILYGCLAGLIIISNKAQMGDGVKCAYAFHGAAAVATCGGDSVAK